MGHIYPGTFVYLLAWSWKIPKYRKRECIGMIIFWLFYWIVDAIEQKGVDFDNLKIVQHYAFTLFIGVAGMFRLYPPNRSLDDFIMFAVVMGFAVFVHLHPQPNDIGVWMHAISAMWLSAFYVCYILKLDAEGTACLIMGSTSFIASQLSLTSIASQHMDVIAYLSCTSIVGFIIISITQSFTAPTHAFVKIPEKQPHNTEILENSI